MRQRFRARELWLLVPFLLIFAGAFYWTRIERVSKPGASEMYVSDFKIEAAPGYWQEKGYSHRVRVTTSHPWPRPKWWGQQFGIQFPLFPLRSEKSVSNFGQFTHSEVIEGGAALTTIQNEKVVPWPNEHPYISYTNRWDGENYIFEHNIKASDIPAKLGAVTFHGLYAIAGSAPVAVTRAIRKAGETLAAPNDRAPGAQLVKVVVGPFMSSTGPNQNGVVVNEDISNVHIFFRRQNGQFYDVSKPRANIYDVEIVDAKGVVYPSDQKGKFRFQNLAGTIENDKFRKQLASDEDISSFKALLDPSLYRQNKLTIRGKISVDEHWPMRFETQFTPLRSETKFTPD